MANWWHFPQGGGLKNLPESLWQKWIMPVNQHLIFRSHGIHIHIQGFSSWSQSVVRPRVSLTKTNEVVLRHWWWGKWRDKFQMSRILGFTWLFNAALIELQSKDYEYWFDLATGSTLFLFFMLIPPLCGMVTHSHLNQVNSSWWKSLTNSKWGRHGQMEKAFLPAMLFNICFQV